MAGYEERTAFLRAVVRAQRRLAVGQPICTDCTCRTDPAGCPVHTAHRFLTTDHIADGEATYCTP